MSDYSIKLCPNCGSDNITDNGSVTYNCDFCGFKFIAWNWEETP